MRSAALCCRSAAARAVQVGIAQPTAALTCRKCAKVASPLPPPTAAAPFGGSQSRCDAVCTSRAVPTMLRFLRLIAVPDIPPPFAADVHRLLCLSQQPAAAAVGRFMCRRSSRVKVRLGNDTSGWPPVLPAAHLAACASPLPDSSCSWWAQRNQHRRSEPGCSFPPPVSLRLPLVQAAPGSRPTMAAAARQQGQARACPRRPPRLPLWSARTPTARPAAAAAAAAAAATAAATAGPPG